MNFKSKIYEMDVEIEIPQDEIFCIFGSNGTYKTKTLERMNEFLSKDHKCLYFGEERYFNIDYDKSVEVLNMIKIDNLNIYDDIRDFNRFVKIYLETHELNKRILNGSSQFINFLINIYISDAEIVFIDFPESNLYLEIRNELTNILNKFGTFKKLICVTHCPSIVNKNKMYSIDEILSIK